ncbi:MAG: AAA family ATPase [Candidatus Micrarchaeota archaeon]
MTYFIIIRGPLGSGKTTIAKAVAKKLKAKYFAIDELLEQLHLDNNYVRDGYISEKAFCAANKKLAPIAEKWLKKGKPVVIDGNFYRKSQIQDLLTKIKYPHFVFTLAIPLKICIERDAKRKQPLGIDAVKAVYAKAMEFSYGVEIDATKRKNETISTILAYIG